MKRLFSILLVAILVVTSLSVTVFAEEVEPGNSASVSVKVSNADGFSYYKVSVNINPNLQITGVSGTETYVISGNTVTANWAAGSNVTEKYLTVNVFVPAGTAPGTYSSSGSGSGARIVAPEEDNDGTADNQIRTSVSVSCESIEVVAPACSHVMGDWTVTTPATCHSDGVETRVCTLGCGFDETRPITTKPAHNWGDWTVTTPAECGKEGEETRECQNTGCTEKETRPVTALKPERDESLPNNGWLSDASGHWYICATCGEKHGSAAHDNKCEDNNDGSTHKVVCKTCGYVTDANEGHHLKLTGTKSGHYHACELCGYKTATKDHNFKNGKCTDCGYKQSSASLPVPDMGDTTPYGMYNAIVFAVAVIALFTVYALVSKRKSVK